MKYDMLDLQNPDTYQSDEWLATLARKTAVACYEELGRGKMSLGELKRAFVAGKYPEIMAKELASIKTDDVDLRTRMAKGRDTAADIVPPTGYRIETAGDMIELHGPFHEDLHARIKRAGGQWDGQAGSNKRCWVIPPEKGASLKRILANWAKDYERSPEELDEIAQREQRTTAKRWLGYVESKAKDGYLYQKGVNTLKRLGTARWPDLQERLDQAIGIAKQAKEAQQDGYRREREANAVERQARRPLRSMFPLSGIPPLNQPIRSCGKSVVFEGTGKPFRINEDHPSVWGSHLLGHEGEMGCYAYFREATEDEVAELERKEAEQQAASDAAHLRTRWIAEIREHIQSQGECPEGWHTPEGERYLDVQNIYGGGDWFVVGEHWIWYCRNNGADGDDWSRNNVRTGGAGAIGWRVPYDAQLAARIAEL